jgi:hypothetical protein
MIEAMQNTNSSSPSDAPKPKKDTSQDDGSPEPDKTPPHYIAPDGRPHIDDNDDEPSTNQPQS